MTKNLFKLSVAINAVVLFVCVALYASANSSDPGDGFNGFAFIWFYISLAVTIVVLMVIAFISGVSRAILNPGGSKKHRAPYKDIAISLGAAIIPVPLLVFSYMANDRHGLRVIGWAALALAGCGVILTLARAYRRR